MTPSRWWIWPLLFAALVDLALVARFETSSGMAVDRAILRSVHGANCQQAVLIHSAASDQLFVIDTWRRGATVVGGTASAVFSPGAGLTPQSKATIAEGGDLNFSMLQHPVAEPPGDGLMIGRYQQQVDAASSWLAGPCLPFANPFQSHLHRLGDVADGGQSVTVYQGNVRYIRGSFQLFSGAKVWMGVRPDGRMGFEVLRETTAASGTLTPATEVTVTTLFQYPQSHLGHAFARQAASERASFYQLEYRRVLTTLDSLIRDGLRITVSRTVST